MRYLSAWSAERTDVPARTAAQVARMLLVLGLSGCSGVEPVAPPAGPITDPAQLYMRLTLDYRALTLSTAAGYNTWQLTATPRNAIGGMISDLPAPTFQSLDTSTVRVTAAGLLTAVNAGTTKITAALVAPGNIRHVDTVLVKVTSLVSPALASLSVRRPGGLPATTAIIPPMLIDEYLNFLVSSLSPPAFNSGVFTPLGLSATGDTVSNPDAGTGIPFEYQSLDPTIMTVTPNIETQAQIGNLYTLRPGQARIVLRTTAYGVTIEDTLVFTVILPFVDHVVARSSPNATTVFQPSEVRISSNGIVFWSNTVNHEVDVTFDDSSKVYEAPSQCFWLDNWFIEPFPNPVPHCVPGNFSLAALPPGSITSFPTTMVRQFPMPGVYTYHSALTGATGRIVVSDPAS